MSLIFLDGVMDTDNGGRDCFGIGIVGQYHP